MSHEMWGQILGSLSVTQKGEEAGMRWPRWKNEKAGVAKAKGTEETDR